MVGERQEGADDGESPSPGPIEPTPLPATMRAVVGDRYGPPGVLELRRVPVPVPEGPRVLVRVVASALNAYDWHMTTGTPYMARMMAGVRRPKRPVPGADVAGVVEAVGSDVTRFGIGDEVFGDIGFGAFAEYAVGHERALARKPGVVGFEEAAATPLAGLTALQGLRDHGGIEAGSRVLVNGASGGVGTFAVQIAKALGAEVTAVCSTSKVELAHELGADRVIDYTRDDYTSTERGYDILFDNAGTRPWSETSRVLVRGGINVTVTGPKHRWLGPLRHLVVRKGMSLLGDRRMTWFTATVDAEDLDVLAGMLRERTVVPVIEDRYPLEGLAEALGRLGEGHNRGKLVIRP